MAGILSNKKIGIIGGGITGVVTAIFLARAGNKVTIFDKNKLLSETSSSTTKTSPWRHKVLRKSSNKKKLEMDLMIDIGGLKIFQITHLQLKYLYLLKIFLASDL